MKINNKGFTFVEILAVILIISLLTGISIAVFSRYKDNAIKSDYEALARSSYNAMEEYMMSHPYDDKVSLETLENENLLSNRKDPASKDTNCTGTVEVSKNAGTNGKIDDGEYKVHLCCVSVQKTYTYPGGKSTDLEDTSNCEYVPEDEPIVPPTPGTTYTLHYNDNGGSGCSSKSITKNAGEAWGNLCTPTKSGYTFKGWKNGSETVTSSSIANGNKTVVAQWSSTSSTKYTLKYNDNGGSGCSSKTITRNKNEVWGSLCTPKRNGYKFNGWYDGSTKYTSSTKATKNVTVKANWTSNTAPKYTCAAGKYLPKNKTSCANCKSAYYCKGGTWPKSTTVDQGLTPCPTGYKNSPTGSKKQTDCYMKVEKKHYVKNKKDSSSTACAIGYNNEYHEVKYNSTSSCYFANPFYDADTKKEYRTLNSAIDNVNGKSKTIKMVKSKYTDKNDNAASLNRPKETITIDLGDDNVLSLKENNIIVKGGTLKIKSGIITTTDAKRSAIRVEKGGKLQIVGGEIKNPFITSEELETEAVLIAGGEAIMTGGKITSGKGSDSGYARGVNITKEGGKFTLKGGTIKSNATSGWGGTGINLYAGEFIAEGGKIIVVKGGKNRCLLCANYGGKIKIRKGTTLVFEKGSVYGDNTHPGGCVYWAGGSGSKVCIQKGVKETIVLSHVDRKVSEKNGGVVLLNQSSC